MIKPKSLPAKSTALNSVPDIGFYAWLKDIPTPSAAGDHLPDTTTTHDAGDPVEATD